MQVIRVDIDNTICDTEGMDYANSKPRPDKIALVNQYYYEGWKVIYWTSRGVGTGIDQRKLTENQLNSWGCKYHELYLDKPNFDLFVDDKAINTIDFN